MLGPIQTFEELVHLVMLRTSNSSGSFHVHLEQAPWLMTYLLQNSL